MTVRHTEVFLHRITDRIHLQYEAYRDTPRIEQEPMTLRLSTPNGDGPTIVRVARAAYDDEELKRKVTALGEDLLTVLDNHGF